ncbi:cholecystokinin receptor type A [Octopus bimaculoides]|uniref:G-protein coupled receptors family 1 profile domain-containing protein n=1 Tax=Octopus bimaculoides TaxID=37653 RepID=A0A0L8FRB5_OCTBM|nr:cholecystokinin receptor type A [Octopus bimaculoides]|eukprot:XP_014787606.1 PREDICTED: cholecystokinin receptor type A-like [Octopus bimaculoides]
MADTMNNTTVPEKEAEYSVEYMLGFFVIVGVLGNGLAICVFARKKEKLPHTIFIITLAFTDFLTCSIVVPLAIYMIHMRFETNSEILCKVYFFLITSNVPFSAFIMVAIAVERYLSVCHPFLHLMKPKSTIFTILTMLLFASSLGVMTSLMHRPRPVPCSNSSEIEVFQSFNISKDGALNITDFMRFDEQVFNDNFTNNYLNSLDNEEHSEQSCTRYFCKISFHLFSKDFVNIYQKVYASLFLLSFLSTLVLYGMIYHCVFWRRAKRWKSHLKQQQILSSNGGMSQTVNTVVDNEVTELTVFKNSPTNAAADTDTTEKTAANASNHETEIILKKGAKANTLKRQITMKDKNRFANFKLAVMLFVVNLVFIFAFLPSWLMAIHIIKFTPIIFYAYFCYNVANPVIYAFLNPSFRKDLYALMCLVVKKRSARQYI